MCKDEGLDLNRPSNSQAELFPDMVFYCCDIPERTTGRVCDMELWLFDCEYGYHKC